MSDLNEPSPAAPTAAEVRAALERILRSACFEHAGRASDFLSFVVAETLAGRAERLKGYSIAIQVFGRGTDFDAQTDPLVRVEALRLRQRLLEYYAGEGAAEPVRIELPRGGYAIKAVRAVVPTPTPTPMPSPTPTGLAAEPQPPRQIEPSGPTWTSQFVGIALLAGLALGMAIMSRLDRPVVEPVAAVAEDRAHKTRIVVVPIENLSSTSEFNRIAASLTEEIMLRLDQLDVFVIATQGTWYGRNDRLEGMLGHEHSYILTGSVLDGPTGARIALRIIEAVRGTQIWSAVYDAPLGSELERDVQVLVAREVAAAAAPFGPVFDAELALARRHAHHLEFEDCQIRYRGFRRATDPALFPEAAACFLSLVERQPDSAAAWAGVAMVEIDEHLFYSGASGAASPLARGVAAAQRALELDANNLTANLALARAQYYDGDPDFLATAENTIALDPTNVDVLAVIGILLAAYGDDVHGLELIARAWALSPRPRPTFHVAHGFAHLRRGEPCKALAATRRMETPNWFITYVIASAAAALCGDEAAAHHARRRLLALSPNFENEGLALVGYWRFDSALNDVLLDGLRKAGLDLKPQP